MASFVSKNVDAEKMDAMKTFETRRMFWKILPAIEVFFAVLLLLSWFTPFLSAGEYLRQVLLSGGLTSGIFIFGVVNVLIALIFSLSNRNKLIEPDLYFQYVSSSATAANDGCSFVASPIGGCSSSSSSSSTVVLKSSASEKEENTSKGKPLATTLENTDTDRPMRGREMVRAVSCVGETDHVIRRKREMTFLPSATTESSAGDQVYRRSRSERLDRGSTRGLCEIDDLSSDEFRSTVEKFIAGKKKMLLKEWMKP
ncbi:hypothetical protein AALP_AA4G085600 [Arabis alpina]|uniref:Uncharacterized protein n=1 Tax=Arabis alpina TaxID=50452 RepID=A0A087H206_ARAAL|nr:hypothetical protein AALP_AA4G085600 [Arabis alpina]